MDRSIFEYSAYRIFCISGNITDSFCTPDLQIIGFEEYLCKYLKNLGYECIAFYSGGGMGLYFHDRESAENYYNMIHKKKQEKDTEKNESSEKSSDEDLFNVFGIKEKEKEPEKKTENKKIKMRYPMENDADFIHKAEALMKNRDKRTVVVFTSLDDFINRTDSVSRRNYNRLFETWRSMSIDVRNICIFLSKGLGTKEIQQILSNNSELSVSSLFITENSDGKRTFNSDNCLVVKSPGIDEINNLLNRLMITGCKTDSGENRRLIFPCSKEYRDELASTMLYYCSAGENGLNTFRNRIEVFMRDQKTEEIPFSIDTINEIYKQKNIICSKEDPEKTLFARKDSGWGKACDVISRNISEYENYIKYHQSDPEKIKEDEKDLFKLERFEKKNKSENRYKIPNFVIQGNPGVGKTEIAKLIGKILYKHKILRSGHTVCASRDTLVGQYVGASAINTVNAIERAQEGVLFIDEVYSLINLGDSSSSGGENYCAEVINTLVAAMTNPKYHFCVVIAGYQSKMNDFFKMNEGLPSRFDMRNVITIDDYKPDILEKIFREQLKKNHAVLDEETDNDLSCYFVNFYKERDRKTFGNARDIITLAKSVLNSASARNASAECTVSKTDFTGTEHMFKGFGAANREEAYSELNKYIGMDFLRQMFDDQCSLYDECKDKGIEYPGPEHMIWVGNPGTGKSTAAKLLSELYYATGILGGRKPVLIDASSIIGTHVGDSQKLINEKMDEAKQNNTVLIIEEAYQLSKDEHYGHAALNAMMNRMTDERKDFNVVFIVYKSEYEDFIKTNAGILSRCTKYDFNDYDPDQLTEIFKKMCHDSKDTYTENAIIKIKEYMTYLYENRDAKTGNARAVERLLAQMRKLRYPRIRNLSNIMTLDKYCFTEDDIPDFRKEHAL